MVKYNIVPVTNPDDVTDAVARQIADIYAPYTTHRLLFHTSYEFSAPTASEMQRRFRALIDAGQPVLFLTTKEEGVLGYAYAGGFRAREGYDWTLEAAIYISSAVQGKGLGPVLYMTLIDVCAKLGYRRLMAFTGDINTRSVQLHKACGFSQVGTMPNVAWKRGTNLTTNMYTLNLTQHKMMSKNKSKGTKMNLLTAFPPAKPLKFREIISTYPFPSGIKNSNDMKIPTSKL
eukprot:PhM_4_TR7315/c0_g1_i1/m.87927/K03823/pat; phosphinothricin acetyltransferase